MPLLRWLILIGIVVIIALTLWWQGLVGYVVELDRTHISELILGIFALTSIHCLYQTIVVSRELTAVRRVRDEVVVGARGFQLVGGKVVTADGRELPESSLTRHIANLLSKAKAASNGKIDQTLLLRSLADQLRGREKLGWFVAEALLRLALLGTAVGFILMLIPIAGLNAFDVETLRQALTQMSNGMSIALTVTVIGIGTALILKLEYYFLDESIAELFTTITEVTEVHVVPVLERQTA
ncbi:MAG: MotA/TolQ/ExbB proton channel family protein [Bauldia sp.]|nr:MotA/TolQ/ExbB proton channel family protein [Bauldia sp.]